MLHRRAFSALDANAEMRWVWDEHPDEEYRRDRSHWRGHGRWNDERWTSLGAIVRGRLRDLHRSVGRQFQPNGGLSILEWGPGGGANLVAVAPFASTLYGVEVSAKNLSETRHQLNMIDAPPFVPILLTGSPAQAVRSIDTPIDVFFSHAVFQLLPSKNYGVTVLRTAFAMMDVDGLGYIHIRYDDGTRRYAPRGLSRYRTDHVRATSWGIAEFWAELEAAGFEPIKVANVNTRNNFAAFYFRK